MAPPFLRRVDMGMADGNVEMAFLLVFCAGMATVLGARAFFKTLLDESMRALSHKSSRDCRWGGIPNFFFSDSLLPVLTSLNDVGVCYRLSSIKSRLFSSGLLHVILSTFYM